MAIHGYRSTLQTVKPITVGTFSTLGRVLHESGWLFVWGNSGDLAALNTETSHQAFLVEEKGIDP